MIKEEVDIRHMDDGDVHLITTADIEYISQKHGNGVSPLRFRPNLVIDSKYRSKDLLDFDQIAIGKAGLVPVKETERCRMITLSQGTLGAEPGLLKSVNEAGLVNFGIYLKPVQCHEVKIGNKVLAKDL